MAEKFKTTDASSYDSVTAEFDRFTTVLQQVSPLSWYRWLNYRSASAFSILEPARASLRSRPQGK